MLTLTMKSATTASSKVINAGAFTQTSVQLTPSTMTSSSDESDAEAAPPQEESAVAMSSDESDDAEAAPPQAPPQEAYQAAMSSDAYIAEAALPQEGPQMMTSSDESDADAAPPQEESEVAMSSDESNAAQLPAAGEVCDSTESAVVSPRPSQPLASPSTKAPTLPKEPAPTLALTRNIPKKDTTSEGAVGCDAIPIP